MSNSNISHDFTTLACNHCGEQITIPIYCGNRFCEICSIPRQARVRKKLTWILSNIKVTTGYRYKHLTLTISSESNISDMIKRLVKSFRRLRQRAYWKNAVKGGAYVVEITGHPGKWHAHIHAIIESRWMDWNRLLKIWIIVSSGRGVWIDNIPQKEAIRYLTKYLTKPDAPDQVTEECGKALSGFRMYQPFGTWHGIAKSYKREPHPCKKCGKSSWYPERCMSSDELAYGMWLRADGIVANYPVRASPAQVLRNNFRVDLNSESL
ncbi:hypothetical protein ES703_79492 [subsurface metagenome]